MPRNFQNLEIGSEKTSTRRSRHEKIGFHRFDFEFEAKIAKKFAVGNHRRGKRVTTNWTTKLPLDSGDILNVIDMPMRQEQKLRLHFKRTQPFTGPLRRVEENRSLWRLKEIAIRFENAAAKALVIHCDLLYPSATTAEGERFYELIECSLVSIV